MAAPKKPTPKKPAARKKSKLTLAGEAAQRGLLLAALKEHRWNLSHVAAALEMGNASTVLRSIKLLGLVEEYDAAKASGKARHGRPVDD
jgi:transcriptional regulator of acetoin/glycerol metabolism